MNDVYGINHKCTAEIKRRIIIAVVNAIHAIA